MDKAGFVLSKDKVIEQYEKLKELGVKVSYSFKTNREVGKVLESLDETSDCEFSIHNIDETDLIKNKSKLWFFSQAWSLADIEKIIEKGVRNFVVDNEMDLDVLLLYLSRSRSLYSLRSDRINKSSKSQDDMIVQQSKVVDNCPWKINLLLRMKFQEHRITSGKYFNYGISAKKVNEIVERLKNNEFIDKLGIHIHRKSQNASEWEIRSELEESLSDGSLKRINVVNLGGGFPVKYRTYTSEILPYIFDKIKEVKNWLEKDGTKIDVYVEPGRFIAAPAVKLQTEILQVQENVIVINTSIYNCALDTLVTDIRLLVEREIEDGEGEYYKIKGNTPTRDDIFRHKVKFKEKPKVGDKIVFLNAGAYNYTTDFCDLEKLETEIV